MYGTDFGWGRPKMVDLTSLDKTPGAISVLDAQNEDGGVEMGLGLNMREMETLASLFAKGFEAF